MEVSNTLRTFAIFQMLVAASSCEVGVIGSAGLNAGTNFSGITGATILSPSSVKVSWDVSSSHSSYQIFSSSSTVPIATSMFSNYIVTNLAPDSTYTFSVAGVENGGAVTGLNKTITVQTWPRFSGITSLTATTPVTLEASWNYPVNGPTFKVFVKAGSSFDLNDPALLMPAVVTTATRVGITQLANGSPIMPNTTYVVLVDATYLDDTSEHSVVARTVKTSSNISPIPTITTDRVILGAWPSFQVSGGLPGYTTTFRRDGQILGSLVGNGTFRVPSSLSLAEGQNIITSTLTYNGSSLELPSSSVFSRFLKNEMVEFPAIYGGKGLQRMGHSMTTGDFNCDGYQDLAVGAPFATVQPLETGGAQDGAVYVFFGSASGLRVTPEPSPVPFNVGDPLLLVRPTVTPNFNALYFGWSLASGNINADKDGANECDDLVVGVGGTNGTRTGTGEAWVFFGSPGGLQTGTPVENTNACSGGTCAPLVLYPPAGSWSSGNVYFGWSVAVGRLHSPVANDKYRDVVVGLPDDRTGGGVGSAWIFYGGPMGLKFSANAPGSTYPFTRIFGAADTGIGAVPSTAPNLNFGSAVAAVNLDGSADKIDDLIIGAPKTANGGNYRGKIYYYSSTTNNANANGAFLPSASSTSMGSPLRPSFDQQRFGGSLANAGDVNGDGIPDLLVGSGFNNEWATTAIGEVLLIYGGTGGPQTSTCQSTGAVGTGSSCLANQTTSCSTGVCSMMGIIPATAYNIADVAMIGFGSGARNDTNDNPLPGTALGNDINGDGIADIVIGLPIPHANVSEARIYYGGNTGVQPIPSIIKPLTSGPFDNVGSSVALGNFNGDGWADVAIAAKDNMTLNGLYGGVVYAYNGKSGGLPPSSTGYDKLIAVNASKENYNNLALPVGDINGDGFDDVAMRYSQRWPVPNSANWTSDAYYIILYFGSSEGLITTPAPSFLPAQSTDPTIVPIPSSVPYGYIYVGAAGDVNGDGYADLVASTYYTSTTEASRHVHLYYGSAAGLQTANEPSYPASGLDPVIVRGGSDYSVYRDSYAFLTNSITHGDFNGDGFSDIVLAYCPSASSKGRALVVYGSPSGIQTDGVLANPAPYGSGTNVVYSAPCTGTIPNLTCKAQYLESLTEGEFFAYGAVAAVGDVNGDGFGDLLVGAYSNDVSGTDNGAAYLFYGGPQGLELWNASASGLLIVPKGVAAGPGLRTGSTVAAAGDVNNDGFADFILGSFYQSAIASSTGGAYLFYGCGNGLHGSALTPGCPATGVWGISASSAISATPVLNAPSCSNGQCQPLFFVPTGWSTYGNGSASWGRSVGTVGDINKDGYGDVVIGSYLLGSPCNSTACVSTNLTKAGAAVLYSGSSSGLIADQNATKVPTCVNGSCSPYWIQPPLDTWGSSSDSFYLFSAMSHFSTHGSHDFNGDGFDDFLLISRNYKNRDGRVAFTYGFYLFQ